jgi:hypothetical protein
VAEFQHRGKRPTQQLLPVLPKAAPPWRPSTLQSMDAKARQFNLIDTYMREMNEAIAKRIRAIKQKPGPGHSQRVRPVAALAIIPVPFTAAQGQEYSFLSLL